MTAEISPASFRYVGGLAVLWNSTDVLPGDYCGMLGLHTGSTYAQAARLIRVVTTS